ncbi:transport and Golgi organization protein 6 homolog [Lampris incognitus]|uniref:transport and Golgi organization protein 6 homolog n=1 Tax=Lampris incognitus TaxID=2546036 RepID=UPI0024B514F1|nr:transport and Golgi organization protein 6 homolog [Lampris incognitus]
MAETSAFISALNLLTKVVGEVSTHDAQSSQQKAVMAALQANQAMLLEQLKSEKRFEDVRKLREETRAQAAWFCIDTGDTTWSFVQECLLLLLALAQHLTVQLELFNQSSAPAGPKLHTPEMAPPLAPDVLSVSQQKTIGAALQFVISLGLCPYLAPGVGVPLRRRSAFGAMVEGLVHGDIVPAVERRLLVITNVLLQMAELASFATLIFTRHLGDVIAALCQLGYRPHQSNRGSTNQEKEISTEERETCREALRSLLGKVYQPIAIKELLILQGGPKQTAPVAGSHGTISKVALGAAPTWLRRLCGQLLSDRLMQPDGVQAVVRAILEGSTGGESDWRKCDSVARILVACPQQSVSQDSYYRQVCPQIVALLHFKDKLTARQFQRVATRAVLTMVEGKPHFAKQHLLDCLLGPLQRCLILTGQKHSQISVCESDSQGTVEEWELTCCVEDLYKIWVVGNSPSDPLMKAMEEVLPVLFTLHCFTKQSVSHLRGPCQEILLWYLGHIEHSKALSVLRQLSGLSEQQNEVAPEFHFTPGSNGGATLSPKPIISDADDALYEQLSEEQWRLECLVHLLAELRDSDLPGDFFLELLQELTNWATEEEEEEEQEVDVSAMTLMELEKQLLERTAGRGQRLVLLQVIAVLCEGLPHTLLLRKMTQVVDFMVSLLQRACIGLGQDLAPGTENPVENQTLNMGMGLIATLLSGPQLSAADYTSMLRLLPSLAELSQKHPEVVIQELASNLRVVIATHGVYRPESLPATDQRTRNPETTQNNQKVCSMKQQKMQPQTKDSHVSHYNLHSSAVDTIHNSPTPHTLANTASTAQPKKNPHPNRTHASFDAEDPQAKDINQTLTKLFTSGHNEYTKTPEAFAPDRGIKSGERNSGITNTGPPTKAFSDLLLEACDPDVPTRAVALRALTRMIQDGIADTVEAQEKVLMLFLENLEHDDAFVYLSAIQGLAVLADSFPEKILQKLLGEFQNNPSLPTSDKQNSLETRLKIGEVLMRASRAMGDLAPHLGRPLIGVFLRGTRDQDQTVRASCLSNLGELCQKMDYALGPLAQELSCCLTALIKTEKEAEVRRAAVHVIALLLRGLSDKTTQVLSDVLLDLYRALKWVVRSDQDDITVLHAQLALKELDDVMMKFIFPDQKLEKKIVVLP